MTATDNKTAPKVDLSSRKILSPYGRNLAALSGADGDSSANQNLVRIGVKEGVKPGVKVGGKPPGISAESR